MKYTKAISQAAIFLGSISVPFISYAAEQTTGIQNPLGSLNSIPNLVSTVLGDAVRVGGVIAIFAFIYAGYKFVAARGNPTELAKAKTIFINTCIGVAVLLGAQLIASIIVGTIGNLRS